MRIQARSLGSEVIGSSLDGQFRTAPPQDQPARVVFAATTGTEYDDQDAPEGGFRIFQSIVDLDTDFFVHTGDILYYDSVRVNLWSTIKTRTTERATHSPSAARRSSRQRADFARLRFRAQDTTT